MNSINLSREDKAAILDLCAEYNWRTDTGDARGVAELFTVNGVWDGEPGRFEGRAAIEQFNRNAHRRLRGAMHFNNNHQFEVRDGVVHHRCYGLLHIPGAEGIQTLLTTYTDVVVRDGDGWRFRERFNRYFDPGSTASTLGSP